ncbi:MAG: hypothetical protein KDE51_18030, partial [Anaerolineales bacterium]|nr:hypothetical protein [Anaerolineales bacterium]
MSQEINFEALTAQLLSIHQASIQAHLDKDVGFFTRGIAENYLSVSRGNINSPTPSEIEARFKSYLENTVFTEYENLQAPLIGFSDDGSLA